jgi:hypothetical protein
LELVSCPQCGQVASIEWSRTVREMIYIKVRCVARHWFLMSAEDGTGRASDRPHLPAARIGR